MIVFLMMKYMDLYLEMKFLFQIIYIENVKLFMAKYLNNIIVKNLDDFFKYILKKLLMIKLSLKKDD